MPSKFQLRAKQIFLTYPQANDIIHNELFIFLKQLGNPNYCIVAREAHKEDGFHYHSFIEYPNIINITSHSHFDFGGKHPNVQGSRNAKSTIQYVRKGGDFLEYGQCTIDTATKPKTSDTLQSLLRGECSISEAIAQNPILLLNLDRIERNLKRLRQLESAGLDHRCVKHTMSIGTQLTIILAEQFKSKCPYIWGPPNTGKTTLLKQLPQEQLFHAPLNNDWTGLTENHKFIIFDEFRGQFELSMILQITQGSKYRLNTKGGSIDLNFKRHCIFLSNSHAQHFYHNSQAWRVRLICIELKSFHSLID